MDSLIQTDFDRYCDLAAEGLLPWVFDKWEAADERGVTLAHVAAMNGTLPPNFKQWDLKTNNNVTVAEMAEFYEKQLWR
jgi:hypothetical protein